MEFYCNFLKYETYDHAFQFPTGWNSTGSHSIDLMQNIGFNSQRDGILQITKSERTVNNKFQFPTGWNSTPAALKYVIGGKRFNSQRDGILPKFKFAVCELASFNSQRDGILHLCSAS